MKIFITLLFAIIIAFSAGCGEKEADCKKDADRANAADVKAEKKKDEKYLCYVGCLEAEKSAKDCKKACYSEKKDKGDVVDSPDDATATKADAASTPDDVSKTNG